MPVEQYKFTYTLSRCNENNLCHATKDCKTMGLCQIGVLSCVVDMDYTTCFITGLSINPEYQNKGNGTKLLNFALNDLESLGAARVELDDMSDHYGAPNNIYIKCGFEYIDVDSGPEMVLYFTQ